jgi:hypothetical protein
MPESNFFRRIEPSDLTFSLNYFSMKGDTVGVAVVNTGEDALTADARQIYENNFD